MPGPEVPPAMLAGTVDAALIPVEYGYSIGMGDVAKYVTFLPIEPTWPEPVIINAKVYDSLPADLQQVLREVSNEVQDMVHLAAVAQIIYSRQAAKEAGVDIAALPDAELAKAKALIEPLEADWFEIAGPNGPAVVAAARDAIARYWAFNLYPK